jgi:hypothetical protein
MKIEVTVTRKALVDPDIAKEIAEGFLEYLDSEGFLEVEGAASWPSYEELAERYVKRLIDPEREIAVLSSLRHVEG